MVEREKNGEEETREKDRQKKEEETLTNFTETFPWNCDCSLCSRQQVLVDVTGHFREESVAKVNVL